MIDINNISKQFYSGNKSITVNSNINFKIPKGSILGLLGPNGAGKTTLIKMICNLITPSSGNITIEGMDISKNPKIVHEKVGVVLEGARNLYNFLTIEDNLNYFSYLNEINKESIGENKEYLLKLFELEDKRNIPVNDLSRGMQQKVAILVAILKDPEILILDEPTLGLDILSQIKMKELLKTLAKTTNKTLIISSHDMSLIEEVCDNIAILHKGKLVEFGNISQIIYNSKEHSYKLIIKNKKYLLNIINEFNYEINNINENTIELLSNNIQPLLESIDESDIYIIERIDNGIEEILKGLGDIVENN